MEFIESRAKSSYASRLTRLTVVLISERSNWVSVPSPLANQLHELNQIPIVLELNVLDNKGNPSKQPQHVHHVAWTGGVLGASRPGVGAVAPGSGGALGVPSALASGLGLRAGVQVQVTPRKGVPEATVVEVEPVGESDWEVVEANAGFLEDQMLGQVSILARGQPFTVWARGGAAVRLRATHTQPADLVRLVPGCEVRVAPKPRARLAADQDPGAGAQGRGRRPPQSTVVPLAETTSWPNGTPATAPTARAAAGGVAVGVRAGGTNAKHTHAPWQEASQYHQQHQQQQQQQCAQYSNGAWKGGDATLPNGEHAGIVANGGGDAPRRRAQSPFATAAATATTAAAGAASGLQQQPPSSSASPFANGTAFGSSFSSSGSGSAGLAGPAGPTVLPGTPAAALAGVGLQARPSWAGNLAWPHCVRASGEVVSGPTQGPSVAAISAAMSAAATASAAGRPGAGTVMPGGSSSRHMGCGGVAGREVGDGGGVEGGAGGGNVAEGSGSGTCGDSDGVARSEPSERAQDAQLDRQQQQQQQQHVQQSTASHIKAGDLPNGVPQAAAPPLSPQLHPLPQPPSPLNADSRIPQPVPQRPLPQPCPPRQFPPQQLCLRVLDLPPTKYLVPLTTSMPIRPEPSPAAAAPPAGPPPEPPVSVWLTLAVAVAPPTAAALLGSAAAAASASAGATDAGRACTALVRLHGRGKVRDLVGVLVPEPACPVGHVMLAPPLQHVLCVLPHMHVTVTALPAAQPSPQPPPPAAHREPGPDGPPPLSPPLPLPSLKLHPLPSPATRHGAAPHPGGSGNNAGRAATAPLQPQPPPPPPSAEELQAYHASLAAAAAAGSGPGSGLVGNGAAGVSPVPHGVYAWLATQMEGIRRAVVACTGDARLAGGSDGGGGDGPGNKEEDGGGPEVLLPLTSGTVVHFRLNATDGGAGPPDGGAAAGGPPPWPGTGDYSLLLHAVRRTHAAHGAAPPVISARMLGAMMGSAAAAAADPLTSPTLGDPVSLPDVTYESARHATALAARPLPPPCPSHSQPAAYPAAAPLSAGPELPAEASMAQQCADDGVGATSGTVAPPVPRPAEAVSRGSAAAAPPTAALATAGAVRGWGGLDLSHISWLTEHVERCLRRLLPQLDPWVAAAVARAGLPRCGGVLVTGPPGSGRSQLLAALGDLAERHPAHQAHVVHVRCGQLAGGTHSATTSALAAVAAEALHCSPCLLLLDDLDLLCPSAAEGSEYGMQHPEGAAAAARLADWLSSLLDELAAAAAAALAEPEAAAAAAAISGSGGGGNGGGVVPQVPAIAVVASVRDAAGVHASLRRVGRLDFEVRLPAPGSRGRAAMLAAAARQRGVQVDPGQLASVAGAAEGFEGVDLKLLLDRAVHTALRRQLTQQQHHQQQHQHQQQPGANHHPGFRSAPVPAPVPAPAAPASALSLSVTEGDLRVALEGFVPAAFWGVQQAAAAGGKAEGWEDVGGLPDVVASLREALLLPVRYRDLVAAAPLRLRTGALLYGPPGCGKTHVVAAAVAAVAKVAPLRFLSVKGPELLNKYIGASEAAVRDLFARAAAAAPAVLFFDEFDAIAPPRGHDSTGVTDRVVNQLLTELDGVEGLRGVVVLAATSRPDLVDAALLRPGRLDRLLFCGPPEGPAQRLEILRALSRRLRLAPDVDLSQIAQSTRGMTGADLGAVLSEAQLHAINEAVEAASQAGVAATHPPAAPGESPRGDSGGQAGGHGLCPRQAGTVSSGGSAVGHAATVASGAGAGAADQTPADARAGPQGAGASSLDVHSGSQSVPPGALGVGPLICMRHLVRAVGSARPSLPAAEAARLEALYARFRQDREAPGARQGQGQALGEGGELGGGKRTTLA